MDAQEPDTPKADDGGISDVCVSMEPTRNTKRSHTANKATLTPANYFYANIKFLERHSYRRKIYYPSVAMKLR